MTPHRKYVIMAVWNGLQRKDGNTVMKKRILIINTGGTLSSVNSEMGFMPGMKSRDMLEELRMVSRNLELETEDFCSVDSANIFPEDWASLAELIAKEAENIMESR